MKDEPKPPPEDPAHLAVQPDAQATPAKKTPKGTKVTVKARVDEVLRLLLAGAEYWDLVQYAAENGWPVGERQIYNYMARAYDVMAERTEKDRTRLINRAIATRRSLLARAMAAADYRTALAIAKDEAQLLNLYPQRQASPANLTDDELEAEIRELSQHAGRPDDEGEAPCPATGEGPPSEERP